MTEDICYGINPLSSNLILVDPKLLKAPSGLILGTRSSGKSFSTRFEMLAIFFCTMDNIVASDLEDEYTTPFNALDRRTGD